MQNWTEHPPSGNDYRLFVLYHHRLFTGYVSAALCGASRYVPALRIYFDWCKTHEQALEEARKRFEDEPMPAAIEAGHRYEPAICATAAALVFGSDYLSGRVKIREAGPIVDSEFAWILATPDALYGRIAVESKFKCFKMPDKPDTEHLFQLHHQMRVLRAPYIYIAYGHRQGATEAARFNDGGALQVRVFLVWWCEHLWQWMWERMRRFKRAFDARTLPAVQDVAERLERAWRSEHHNEEDLPPRPHAHNV